jgi:hypothetical protein
MSERVRLGTGGGPLGTGVFLLGRRGAHAEPWDARAWVTLLFLPLVPLGASRFHGPSERPTGESWEVDRTPLEAPRGDVLQTYGGAAGLLLLAVAPVAFAWWTIHQTGLLQALKVVIGASVPILVLMWRDAKTPRVLR